MCANTAVPGRSGIFISIKAISGVLESKRRIAAFALAAVRIVKPTLSSAVWNNARTSGSSSTINATAISDSLTLIAQDKDLEWNYSADVSRKECLAAQNLQHGLHQCFRGSRLG